jgi:transposase
MEPAGLTPHATCNGMDKFKLFCGIDVSKANIDVVYGTALSSRHVKLSNDVKGISRLLNMLLEAEPDRSAILVCCENTGALMDKLACVLKGEDLFLWVVHPLLLSYFSIDLNRFKTDKADAQKIFTYAMMMKVNATSYHLASQPVRQLRELFTCRKSMIQTRSAYICRIQDHQQKATCDPLVLHIEKQLVNVLNELIKALEKAIAEAIASDKKIKRIYRILISIPSIGPVTAWHLLFITDCFDKFKSAKALAAYIGCAPYPRQSGSSVKHKDRVSKKSYKPLKADLNQGIVSVCTRPGQLFHQYYNAMIKSNRHHLYILNNIKNILIKLVFKLIKDDMVFDADKFMNNKLSWQKHLQMS